MDIVYTSDDNGDKILAVSVHSLLFHHEKSLIKLHILLPLGDRLNYTLKVIQDAGVDHTLYPINTKLYDFVKDTFGHIPLTSFFKFSIADVVKAKRVLYLDFDTIIIKDLSEMFYDKFLKSPIAGVAELGLNRISTYVNCGVLLINLEAIKDLLTINSLREKYSKNNFDKSFAEQDIINDIIRYDVTFLQKKYNVHPSKIPLTCNVKIIHFYGSSKPWDHYIIFGSKYFNFHYKLIYKSDPISISFLQIILDLVNYLKTNIYYFFIFMLKKVKAYNFVKKVLKKFLVSCY